MYFIDKLISLFTHQLELAKIEAKIEEINLVRETFYRDGMHRESKLWAADRLSELTKQKDLLTKGE